MSREVKASCQCCGRKFDVRYMFGTPSRKRNMGAIYQCERCHDENLSYGTTNDEVKGKNGGYKHGLRFGPEVELSFSNAYARGLLFEYGCIPTHDGSLNPDERNFRYGYDHSACEYVSPIFEGKPTISKLCLTLEHLRVGGYIVANDSCGTHLHVSMFNMRNKNGEQVYMSYIRRFYHSLFVPLCKYMETRPEDVRNVFGRPFNPDYADRIDWGCNVADRYNFINVMNDSNIEFRLCKFDNGKQYQNLVHMCGEMVQCIVTNFCEHFDVDIAKVDAKRYYKVNSDGEPMRLANGNRIPSKTAYRKHKAEVTANKLIKIFQKYANK